LRKENLFIGRTVGEKVPENVEEEEERICGFKGHLLG
jgi:hypothetical protein